MTTLLTRETAPVHTDKTCFLVRGALLADACEDTVRSAWSARFQPMDRDYPSEYRNNDRRVLDDDALATSLFVRLRPTLPSSLTLSGETWRLVGLNSRFRLCRYTGGQSFSRHRDGAWSPSPSVRSQLTVMLYLDDADRFEGGHTRFYEGAHVTGRIRPERGMAIVFDHTLWHDGEPVHEGAKHVLRTDVLYERAGSTEAGHTGYVWAVAARADGSWLSGARDCTIREWREGRVEGVWRGHTASVTALAEVDGVVWSGSRDRTVRRWDGGVSTILHRSAGAVLALAACPGGVAVSDAAGVVTRLEGPGRPSWRAHDGWAWALAALPDGRLISGGDDGALIIWSHVGTCDRFVGLGAPVRAVAAAAGQIVAGLADGRVVVLSSALELRHEWLGHTGPVTSVAMGPDGQLVTGGEDNAVRVWRDTREVATWRHADFVRSVAVTLDGAVLSGSYDGTVRCTQLTGG